MGFVGNVGPGTFDPKFDPTSSAEDCCKKCLSNEVTCIGWIFDANNPYTPCTKVTITSTQPGQDTQCRNGYADGTRFSSGKFVAGMGPCSHGSSGP